MKRPHLTAALALALALAAAAPSPAAATQGPAHEEPTAPREQALLEEIRRQRDGDRRQFGTCFYRWSEWKLAADGTRTTAYSCLPDADLALVVAVRCTGLQLNTYTGAAWGQWRLPAAGGEERMVAALCANAMPAPITSTVQP